MLLYGKKNLENWTKYFSKQENHEDLSRKDFLDPFELSPYEREYRDL